MRRSGIWLTTVLAVVVGVLLGIVLFTQVGPVPLPATTRSSEPDEPSGSPTDRPSTPRPTPSPEPSGPRSPSTSPGSPSPSVSPSDPAFTLQALLQPTEIESIGGFSKTTQVRTWNEVPPEQVTSCTAPQRGDGKPRAAFAAIYSNATTTTAEVVLRYADETTAADAVQALRARVAACADEPAGDPQLRSDAIEAPEADGVVDEAYLWDTTANATSAQGMAGVVRSGDRVALLTMVSLTTDPTEGTDLASLLTQAGRRLV